MRGSRYAKKADVLFYAATAVRDLPWTQKVAEVLLDRYGVHSVIGYTYFDPLIAKYCRVCVGHRIVQINQRFVRNCRYWARSPLVFVNADPEQLANWETFPELFLPEDDFAKNKVYHLAWYDFNWRLYIDSGVPEHHVYTVGNYNDWILQTALKRSSVLRDQLSRRFGIPLRKTWYFFPMNLSDLWVKEFNLVVFPENLAYMKEELEYFAKLTLGTFLEFWDRLRRDPDAVIIVRPHPGVPIQVYEDLFRERWGKVPGNVLCTKEGIAHEWVVASDWIISSWSTVAFNAHNVGKPSLLLLPEAAIPKFLRASWINKMPIAHSYEEFMAFKQAYQPRVSVSEVETFPYRVAEVIVKAMNDPEAEVPPMTTAERRRAWKEMWRERLRAPMRRWMGRWLTVHRGRVGNVARRYAEGGFRPIWF